MSKFTIGVATRLGKIRAADLNISNATFTDWAIHDLLALVCDAYLIPSVEKVTLPKGCPVRLEIYFEMLCPDTSRFFLKVFDPFWKRLRSITDLHLIPFGKANVWLNEEGTDYEFQCQYGPAECQQNKIASCVIEYLPVDLQFEFLTCMMQDKTDGEVGQKCAERLSIAWEPLQECATTREGSTLLFHNGARTMNLKPRLFFVPTVTINGFYDVDQLERSLNSLDDLICEAYMTPFSRLTQVLTPKGCKLQVIIFFTTASKESSIFILVQIAPVWKKLGSRVLNIEFIPLGSDGNHLDKHCHGNAECTLDQIFACAVVTYSSTEQLEFLTCIYQYNATLEASKKCSQILGLSWDRLSRCQRGSHGPSLLETNIKKANALRPSLHTLPTVVLNGYYDKSHLKESLEDLMSQVCSSFYDPTELTSKVWKPRGCPVTVEVYLQSLCPNSKRFFLNQLVPAWKKLHSVIDLKIIPFGKATGKLLNPDTGEYQFACQHGPLECHGNKVFSCIVKHMSVHDQMKIFECLYMKQFPAIEGRECAEKLGLNWGGVLNCIDEDGSRLLYENGWLTGNLKPSVFFIPTITINKFYSKAALRQTLRDLSGVVCETYLADDGNSNIEVGVPEGCKVSLTIFFHSLDDQMKFVFSQEIEEIWRIFQNILNLRFVPISGSSLLPSQNSTDTTEKSSNSFCDIYDNECYVSKALSCLTLTQTADIQMKFLACLMSQDDLRRGSVAQCARELFLDSGDLDECATVKGAEILKENDKHFGNYLHRAKALPLVVVNKAVIKEQSNLRRVTCLHYKGPKPQECNHSHSNYTKDKSTH